MAAILYSPYHAKAHTEVKLFSGRFLFINYMHYDVIGKYIYNWSNLNDVFSFYQKNSISMLITRIKPTAFSNRANDHRFEHDFYPIFH